jgi:hypothetical protein
MKQFLPRDLENFRNPLSGECKRVTMCEQDAMYSTGYDDFPSSQDGEQACALNTPSIIIFPESKQVLATRPLQKQT